jgi:hypothetical protein
MKKAGVFAVAAALLAVFVVGAPPAYATLDMQKKAKAAGLPATACDYCHTAKLPKKDAHELNDRGNWLKAEKEKRGAKDIDVTWLKEYVEPKK